jgi:predicted Zn-dependent peptidase
MKKILVLIFILSALLTQNAKDKVEEMFLSNGIKVLFDKTDGAKIVSMAIFTPVSLYSEDEEMLGITALTLDLMSAETENRSAAQLAGDIKDIGMTTFFTVNKDNAYFGFTVLSDYFDEAAEIASDILISPNFDPELLMLKKADALKFIEESRITIENVLSDEFFKSFYDGSPYAHNVFGTAQTVQAVSIHDIKYWHRYAFNASNIVLSVSGNIDKKVLRNSLERYFSRVAFGKHFIKPSFDIKKPQEEIKRIKGKYNQSAIAIGFYAIGLNNKDSASLALANMALGVGFSSRFFKEIRENLALTYDVNSEYEPIFGGGHFKVSLLVDKRNVNMAANKINEILRDFYERGISAQELKNAKDRFRSAYVFSLQSNADRARAYGIREITGKGYKYVDEFIDVIDKITIEDVNRVSQAIFSQKSWILIIE